MKFILTLLLAAFSFNLFAQINNDYISVNSGVKYQYLGTYDIERLNKITTTELAEFAPFKQEFPKAVYTVKLYRVQYQSVIPEQNNRPTTASGLIAIPETGIKTMPVVSYQHGTVFGKNEVPSYPEESYETRLMIAQFAGQGYIVIAADYFGKGISTEANSYLVKESTEQACVDMLNAANDIIPALGIKPGTLFLSGWSQGSWNTLVFLKKLEGFGVQVKAAAIESAPTDLYAILNRWIHNPKPVDAVYLPSLLALMANAYEFYYEVPGMTTSIIRPEYYQASKDLFQNKISFEEFYKKTPAKLTDLITTEFADVSSVGTNHYWKFLQREVQAFRWRSVTPLYTYYGEIDEVVPEYIATIPVGYQQIMGGATVTSFNAGSEANHRGTFIYGAAHQKKWFDSLLK